MNEESERVVFDRTADAAKELIIANGGKPGRYALIVQAVFDEGEVPLMSYDWYWNPSRRG